MLSVEFSNSGRDLGFQLERINPVEPETKLKIGIHIVSQTKNNFNLLERLSRFIELLFNPILPFSCKDVCRSVNTLIIENTLELSEEIGYLEGYLSVKCPMINRETETLPKLQPRGRQWSSSSSIVSSIPGSVSTCPSSPEIQYMGFRRAPSPDIHCTGSRSAGVVSISGSPPRSPTAFFSSSTAVAFDPVFLTPLPISGSRPVSFPPPITDLTIFTEDQRAQAWFAARQAARQPYSSPAAKRTRISPPPSPVYMGQPLSCAQALAALDEIDKRNLLLNAGMSNPI